MGGAMNSFDALNVFYREDAISDFLVNCFRDSPSIYDTSDGRERFR